MDSIKEICTSNVRVPFEYRKNREELKKFIETIISNSYIVTNKYVSDLINIYNTRQDEASVVHSIKYCGDEDTYDIEVNNSHSYVANGIIAHNTCNLPNNVTEEKVSEIYIESWKRGLKGITVYRDGCRSGVIVSSKKDEDNKDKICVNNNDAKRRPKSLDAKILRFSNKGDKWVGIIGMLDGKPYELFTGMLDRLNIPSWVDSGTIIKNYEEVEDAETGMKKKVSRYDLCYKDSDGFCVCVEGISRIFNPEFWNYGKLISGLLRHHMPISYITKVISSLKLDDSSINTWKNGIVRVLRKFEGETTLDEKCPECGGRLVRENGCVHCIDCGYSKCS